MAFPSISYVFTNGTTADATQVNQDYTDLINGFSDGTKSLNMAAGTFSGTVSISGAVTLGLSSSNLITFNGSLNTSIPLSTTNSFDIGSDPFGLRSIYFGSGSSAHSTRLIGGAVTSAYTLTLPVTAPSNGQIIQSDGSGNLSFINNPTSSISVNNAGLASSVGSSALTVALKGQNGSDPSSTNIVTVNFRNTTATTGTPSAVSVTAALSLTVASGATLGHTSAAADYIYVYLINNAGTAELAVSSSSQWDEGTLQNTTALSSGSTSAGVLYSTVSRTGVGVRLIGRMISTQATAGTWATGVSEITLFPFKLIKNSEIYLDTGNGFGSGNTKIRRFTNVVNNVGVDLTLTQDSTNGDMITVNTAGLYSVCVCDRKNGGGIDYGFSVNSSALTTAIGSVSYANGRRLLCSPTAATCEGNSRSLRLNVGDIIRHHSDGTATDSGPNSYLIVTKLD